MVPTAERCSPGHLLDCRDPRADFTRFVWHLASAHPSMADITRFVWHRGAGDPTPGADPENIFGAVGSSPAGARVGTVPSLDQVRPRHIDVEKGGASDETPPRLGPAEKREAVWGAWS